MQRIYTILFVDVGSIFISIFSEIPDFTIAEVMAAITATMQFVIAFLSLTIIIAEKTLKIIQIYQKIKKNVSILKIKIKNTVLNLKDGTKH